MRPMWKTVRHPGAWLVAWGLLVALGSVVLWFAELRKAILRRSARRRSHGLSADSN